LAQKTDLNLREYTLLKIYFRKNFRNLKLQIDTKKFWLYKLTRKFIPRAISQKMEYFQELQIMMTDVADQRQNNSEI